MRRYCGSDEKRLLSVHSDWPDEWNSKVAAIYADSKFESKLAETWFQQNASRVSTKDSQRSLGRDVSAFMEEEGWKKEYWRKERRGAILMQIASSCHQRRLYGGWDTILALSGDNILVFLSLCREVWDIQERVRSNGDENQVFFGVEVQTQAIRSVSESWLKKQSEFPGGSRRQDFIRRLGIGIRKALINDIGLVYPGHNGFSLLEEECDRQEAQDVRDFLATATDFGALISLPHTTKERDGRPRRKWYLFPILCPNFEIPSIRTKEPYYADLVEVRHWLDDEIRPAIVFRRAKKRRRSRQDEQQSILFNDEE